MSRTSPDRSDWLNQIVILSLIPRSQSVSTVSSREDLRPEMVHLGPVPDAGAWTPIRAFPGEIGDLSKRYT